MLLHFRLRNNKSYLKQILIKCNWILSSTFKETIEEEKFYPQKIPGDLLEISKHFETWLILELSYLENSRIKENFEQLLTAFIRNTLDFIQAYVAFMSEVKLLRKKVFCLNLFSQAANSTAMKEITKKSEELPRTSFH